MNGKTTSAPSTINLSKGGNVSLTKDNPSISNFKLGLSWDAKPTAQTGSDFDLDASVFCIGADNKIPEDAFFVYYNNLQSPCGGIVHNGDNRTGAGDGDDEVIDFIPSKIDPRIEKCVIVVTIHEAAARNQIFGNVEKPLIRIFDEKDPAKVIASYELAEDFSIETAVCFGELYKNNGEWKFRAVGTGMRGGLADYLTLYKK